MMLSMLTAQDSPHSSFIRLITVSSISLTYISLDILWSKALLQASSKTSLSFRNLKTTIEETSAFWRSWREWLEEVVWAISWWMWLLSLLAMSILSLLSHISKTRLILYTRGSSPRLVTSMTLRYNTLKDSMRVWLLVMARWLSLDPRFCKYHDTNSFSPSGSNLITWQTSVKLVESNLSMLLPSERKDQFSIIQVVQKDFRISVATRSSFFFMRHLSMNSFSRMQSCIMVSKNTWGWWFSLRLWSFSLTQITICQMQRPLRQWLKICTLLLSLSSRWMISKASFNSPVSSSPLPPFLILSRVLISPLRKSIKSSYFLTSSYLSMWQAALFSVVFFYFRKCVQSKQKYALVIVSMPARISFSCWMVLLRLRGVSLEKEENLDSMASPSAANVIYSTRQPLSPSTRSYSALYRSSKETSRALLDKMSARLEPTCSKVGQTSLSMLLVSNRCIFSWLQNNCIEQ